MGKSRMWFNRFLLLQLREFNKYKLELVSHYGKYQTTAS
jgi:hypothetical protein